MGAGGASKDVQALPKETGQPARRSRLEGCLNSFAETDTLTNGGPPGSAATVKIGTIFTSVGPPLVNSFAETDTTRGKKGLRTRPQCVVV